MRPITTPIFGVKCDYGLGWWLNFSDDLGKEPTDKLGALNNALPVVPYKHVWAWMESDQKRSFMAYRQGGKP